MADNVKYFNSRYDLHKFVLKQAKREIGEGSEGTVYLTKNNEAIKEMFYTSLMYPHEDLIMESDIKLDSFLFPKELYVIGQTIYGYTADYFHSIFTLFDGNIKDIDVDALIKAGYKMIDDIKVLSDKQYILYDLPNNILFDGTSLKAIDTIHYYRSDKASLEKNIEILRDSLLTALDYHDEYCSSYDKNVYTRKLTKAFK